MTEQFKNELMIALFFGGKDIPSWGKWIAVDYDGEVCVFNKYPVLVNCDSDLMWDNKSSQRTHRSSNIFETLIEYNEWINFPELQIISVEDLLT